MSPRTIPIINLAVLAHVDAGKTTLTEGMLFASGAIGAPGRVDDGTSVSDSMAVEKARGISVRLSSTGFSWKDTRVNLIDTPGHADFSAEVERAVLAADCALLIVCAVEGVQAQTRAVWSVLRERKTPTIVFINKLDRVGADSRRVLNQLSKELGGEFVPLQAARDHGSKDATLCAAWSERAVAAPENPTEEQLVETIMEAVAGTDDSILEEYLEEGAISFDRAEGGLISAVKEALLFPVFMGIASTGMGTKNLLNGMVRYLPRAKGDASAPLNAVIYKVSSDSGVRTLSVRVFDGVLEPRDSVDIPRAGVAEKVSALAMTFGSKERSAKSLEAGQTGFVRGLPSALPGDLLGTGKARTPPASLGAPLMTVRARPACEKDYGDLAAALSVLCSEDPALNLRWYKDTRELHLDVRGKIQMEILTSVLEDRFDLAVLFDEPTVIYKETPVASQEVFERYWMPKPCWAIVRFAIDPLPAGGGVVFESQVSEDKVAKRYQREIERHLPVALAQGPSGWEVTDLKITLLEGEDHQIHTRPGDFAVATSMALMNGLTQVGTRLLEPVMSFTMDAPEESLARVSSDLRSMRGAGRPATFDDGLFSMEGEIPAATSMDYPALFASRTGGKGRFMSRFEGYRPCPQGCGETRPFRGISPLDRSKFILHARKAFG